MPKDKKLDERDFLSRSEERRIKIMGNHAKWRCPSCRLWVSEEIGKVCTKCQKA